MEFRNAANAERYRIVIDAIGRQSIITPVNAPGRLGLYADPQFFSHHNTASSGLLRGVRIVLLVYRAPNRWDHEVLGAIRV